MEIEMITQLLSVKEIEQSLGLGHTKTAELIRTGEIQSIRLGAVAGLRRIGSTNSFNAS